VLVVAKSVTAISLLPVVDVMSVKDGKSATANEDENAAAPLPVRTPIRESACRERAQKGGTSTLDLRLDPSNGVPTAILLHIATAVEQLSGALIPFAERVSARLTRKVVRHGSLRVLGVILCRVPGCSW